jgi:peptidoglycan/xylan/chitin deacetylase (PgdA/CDA1 family)
MKKTIKLVAGEALAALGLPRLLHKTFFRNQLTIVMYHGVVREPLAVKSWNFIDKASFQAQIAYLKCYFRVVHFSDAIELLRDGRIDQPTAAITFDDGFQNNYDVAFPILRNARIPAIVFLTTGFLDSDDTVWFCRLRQALSETKDQVLNWCGSVFDLSTANLKRRAIRLIQNKLKELPYPRLLQEVRQLAIKIGDDPDRPIKHGSPFRMLSYHAIDRMLTSGLIEFGAHTHSHAILSRLSAAERQREIESSVLAVGALTGRPCEFFAYPDGGAEDQDDITIAILRACGVRAAVTTQPGPNRRQDNLLRLSRYGFGLDDSQAYFQATVHHTTSCIKRLLPI